MKIRARKQARKKSSTVQEVRSERMIQKMTKRIKATKARMQKRNKERKARQLKK